MKKRKIIAVLLILVLIVSASSAAFAKVNTPEQDVMPQYLATFSIMTSFVIDANGVNAPVFWHGIALLNCHRTAHFSVWKTSGASVIGMSHLLHGFV